MSDEEFNISWGGAKVMITEPNVIIMREWIGKGNPKQKIIGVNKLSDMSHLSAMISLLDLEEPTSCNEFESNIKELINLQTLDRVEKNEIPAIELMLRERYQDQELALIERSGKSVIFKSPSSISIPSNFPLNLFNIISVVSAKKLKFVS